MAGRNFRRGKGNGSGDNQNDGKINNSVSASDGRADDAYVPPAPRPVQPRTSGRTDLSPAEGSRLNQQMYSATTPQMGRKQKEKLDAMKNAASEQSAPTAAVPAVGMGAAAAAASDYVSPTDEHLHDLARLSIDDQGGWDNAKISWMNEADMDRFDKAVDFQRDVDTYRGNVQQAGNDLSQVDLNSLSVEGHTVTRGGLTYLGDKGLIVVDNGLTKIEPGKEDPRPRLDAAHVQEAIAAREAAEQQQVWAQNPKSVHEERHAVYFSMGDTRVQFSESSPWETTAKEHWGDLRRDLVLNGQEAIAERLHIDIQTPEERAHETAQALEGPRHEVAFRELTGEEFPSSTPMSVEDQKAIVDAYDKAPAVVAQKAAEATTAPQSPEEKQATADKMFTEGRDLRDIHAHTGTKPEGAEQAAWEKTEFVYGQPTALDRLQEMGKGGHAVSESGYTYAMSADGKELIRFDANLQEAGRKSVEDVQAYLHEKRGVEFDKLQEQKQAEIAALPTQEEVRWNEADIAAEKAIVDQQQEKWDQSKEYAEAAVVDMNESAAQPMSESQQETAALLRGDQIEVQQKEEAASASEVEGQHVAQGLDAEEAKQDTVLDLEIAKTEEVSERKAENVVEVESEVEVKVERETEAEKSNEVAPESVNNTHAEAQTKTLEEVETQKTASLEMKVVDEERKLDAETNAKVETEQHTEQQTKELNEVEAKAVSQPEANAPAEAQTERKDKVVNEEKSEAATQKAADGPAMSVPAKAPEPDVKTAYQSDVQHDAAKHSTPEQAEQQEKSLEAKSEVQQNQQKAPEAEKPQEKQATGENALKGYEQEAQATTKGSKDLTKDEIWANYKKAANENKSKPNEQEKDPSKANELKSDQSEQKQADKDVQKDPQQATAQEKPQGDKKQGMSKSDIASNHRAAAEQAKAAAEAKAKAQEQAEQAAEAEAQQQEDRRRKSMGM